MNPKSIFEKCLILFTAAMATVRGANSPTDFQTYLLRHGYEAVRTESKGGEANHQTIDLEINGKRVTLLIDTGAPRTVLTNACARRLRLDVHDLGKAVVGVGGVGKGNVGMATISSFKIGAGEINHLSTIVVLPPHSELDVDGLLGIDSLNLNAAIIPVGGHGILIKPGPAPAVSIDSFMSKLGFKRIPLAVIHDALLVQGSLDGKPLVAQIDTGDGDSCFDTNYVKSASTSELHGLEGSYTVGAEGLRTNYFVFMPHALMLGGFTVPPLMLTAEASPTLEKERIDLLVGYDILGLHRAVIDTGFAILWMR